MRFVFTGLVLELTDVPINPHLGSVCVGGEGCQRWGSTQDKKTPEPAEEGH